VREEQIYKLKRIYWGVVPEIKEWHRALTFAMPGKIGDLIRKRYASKRFGSCGKNLFLDSNVKIYNPQNLKVGDDVNISEYTQISAGGGVTFGNSIMVSPFVKIWSINHKFERIDIPILDQGWSLNPVVIEDDVWIAMGAIILPGVHIGKGSIISAGTVLGKKRIKPYSMVSGNPGRIIGSRVLEPNL